MGLDAPSLHAHEHLGRRSDDREPAHAYEIHVGRRVDVAQRPIDRERIGLDVGLEALREDGLIDVARGNSLLDRADAGLEYFPRLVGSDLRWRLLTVFGLREPALELAFQELDLGARELIQRAQVFVGRDARVGDDQNPVLHVVERQHRIEQHEAGIVFGVCPRIVLACRRSLRPGLLQRGLEDRRGIVADEADGSTRESRQAGHEWRLEPGHQAAQRRYERLVALRRRSRSLERGPALPRAQDQEGILPEEGVSRHLFPTLDALKKERVVGVLGNLEERGDRRQQVGDDLLDHRHERASPRQLDELLERGLLHHHWRRSLARPLHLCYGRSAVAATSSPAVAAASKRPAGGRCPVHNSNWRSACAISISMPPIVWHPAARAPRRSSVSAGA